MHTYSSQVTDLRYNAAEQQFEALIVLHEGADCLRYPASLKAPITTDFRAISRALVVQAKVRRAREAQQMYSRIRAASPELPQAA